MRRFRNLGLLGVVSAACLAPMNAIGQDSGGAFPPKKKKEEKKEVRFDVVKARTNLDNDQLAQIGRVENMFGKLYGLQQLPDEAKELVKDAIFATLDGLHQPEREKTDVLTEEMITVLKDRQLGSYYALQVVRGIAELLSADEMSKEQYDGLMVEIEKNLSGSRIPRDRQEELRKTVHEIVMNSELNEAKVEAREKERQAQAEREEKERKRKLEEAKRKAKRRQRGEGAAEDR